jgi:N-methylhydantoinase B
MVAQEAGIHAARSAGSTVIIESAEVACVLLDQQGRQIVQNECGQLHISALRSMLLETLRVHPLEELRDGDVLISNDPFLGGIHPTDVGAFRPILYENKPVFFCGLMMFVSDLGGMSAGGLPANATECFHEGLILPPLKLYRSGVADENTFAIIRSNSRTPEKIISDVNALAAGGNVAARGMDALISKYGYERLSEVIDELLDYTERVTRQGIEAIPDGVYRGSYEIEEDGVEENKSYLVEVTITIRGSNCSLDFTGTSPQARGPINSSSSQSLAFVVYALRCYLDPSLSINEGFYRPFEMIFPSGTLTNPNRPAACNLRMATGMAMIDSINQALAPVFPHLVTGANSTPHTFTIQGTIPGTTTMFTSLDCNLGLCGARPTNDANDGLPYAIMDASGYDRNVEAYEIAVPVIYHRHAFLQDSGGAGKWRGSCSVIREVEFLTDVKLSLRATDRCRLPPRGAAGGLPGKGGQWILNREKPTQELLPSKKTNHQVRAGDILTAFQSAGGGFGNPLERDPERVLKDVRLGRVSVGAAADHYGVVINSDTHQINTAATARLRRERKGIS